MGGRKTNVIDEKKKETAGHGRRASRRTCRGKPGKKKDVSRTQERRRCEKGWRMAKGTGAGKPRLVVGGVEEHIKPPDRGSGWKAKARKRGDVKGNVTPKQ